MDLFDWLSVLSHLKQCGFKGVEIADKLGWSPQKVSDYNNVLERLSATVLEIAKEHQNGEGGEKIRHGGFHRTLVPRQRLICPMRKVSTALYGRLHIADGCKLEERQSAT